MGDMADDALDQVIDEMIGETLYDPEDWSGLVVRRVPACRYCGAKLRWRQMPDGKWRLHNAKGPHTCKAYSRAKARLDGVEADWDAREGRP